VVLVCDSSAAAHALATWKKDPLGSGAALIGTVSEAAPGRVVARTVAGGRRIIDLPMGEILPRIC